MVIAMTPAIPSRPDARRSAFLRSLRRFRAGAMVFLSLGGTLIWNQVAGPRPLPTAVALGGFLGAILIASSAG